VCCGYLVADLVMRIPRLPLVPEHAQEARSLVVEPGGAGNLLITAARLGGCCVAFGPIGADTYGQAVFDLLAAEGVDVAFAQRGAGSLNSIVLVFVDDAGQHVFVAHDGTGEPFHIGSGEEAVLREAGVLFIPGFALVERRMAAATLKALRLAARAGVPVFSDIGPIVNEAAAREAALKVISHGAVCFLTADEAMAFTGKASYDLAARALRQVGARVVVIKRGARGCVVFDDERMTSIPGIPVEARDTTAAGDSFAGGFAVAWLKHGDAVRAAAFANIVAAAKVQKIGSGRQCPTAAEVEAVRRMAARAPLE
jgi:sugar/nucleoside kinase (ribokinase family)